jgi:hypothetical protein
MLDEGISQGFSSLASTNGVSGTSIFGYGKDTFNLTQSSSSTFYGDLVGGFSFVKGGSGTITLSGARGAAETVSAGAGGIN